MRPVVKRTGLGSLCLIRSGGVSRVCVGAVESELGQVMLAYTVLFVFSAKTLNCCDLMLLLLVLEFMQVCVFVYRYS